MTGVEEETTDGVLHWFIKLFGANPGFPDGPD